MCDLETPETFIHKFYDYPRAKMAWTWAANIIYILKHPPNMDGNMYEEAWCQAMLVQQKKTFCKPKGVYASSVLYNTNGFGTETIYDYYIVMKSMFLGCKIFLSPFIVYASFTIFLP